MFFRNRPPPPSHFRRYFTEKKSWSAVNEQLRFRPKGDSLSLWREIVRSETHSALKTSACLLSVQLYEYLIREGQSPLKDIDEEIVIHECLMFSSSFLAFHLEDFFIFLEEEKDPPLEVSSFADHLDITYERMSLLDYNDIEETELERVPLYQECYETRDWQNCLSRTFARVLSRLADGEHFTQIKLRAQDPVDLRYELGIMDFIADTSQLLDEIANLLEKQVDEAEMASMTLRG